EEDGSEEIEAESEESDSEMTVTDAGELTLARFDWEETAEVQGEQTETEAKDARFGYIEEYFDVEDEGHTATEDAPIAPVVTDKKKKGKSRGSGVNPLGRPPDYDLLHLQAEFDRALKVNARLALKVNARFEKLLQTVKQKPQPLLNHRNL
ncbi:hypothetical protein Dimus_005786, partial [Dionaea muscipula]